MKPPKHITQPVLDRIIQVLSPFKGLPYTRGYIHCVKYKVVETLTQASVDGLIRLPPGGFGTKVSVKVEDGGNLLVDFDPELKGTHD